MAPYSRVPAITRLQVAQCGCGYCRSGHSGASPSDSPVIARRAGKKKKKKNRRARRDLHTKKKRESSLMLARPASQRPILFPAATDTRSFRGKATAVAASLLRGLRLGHQSRSASRPARSPTNPPPRRPVQRTCAFVQVRYQTLLVTTMADVVAVKSLTTAGSAYRHSADFRLRRAIRTNVRYPRPPSLERPGDHLQPTQFSDRAVHVRPLPRARV